MFTEHVTALAEDYLNNRLSPDQRKAIEHHLTQCPNCARYYFNMERLQRELNTTMKQALGEPTPPRVLRQQLHQRMYKPRAWGVGSFFLVIGGRLLSTVGTIAAMSAIVFLLFSAWQITAPPVVVYNPLASAQVTATPIPRYLSASQLTEIRTITVEATIQIVATPTLPPTRPVQSLGEVLPKRLFQQKAEKAQTTPTTIKRATKLVTATRPTNDYQSQSNGKRAVTPSLKGIIAFAVFDPISHQQQYQTYLINLNNGDTQLFPLDGVSEPALHKTQTGYRLAYRVWGDPARALFSSDLSARIPDRLTDFWEDGQPDWSPIENRIIYASQRESDRKWRLYTAWGDGSFDKNLRREGKSPSFAPDGQRFVFESCNEQGNECGLWQATLEDSEHGANLFLNDALAKTPDWSPNDNQIVYVSNNEDNWDIYLTNNAGATPERLTTHPAIDMAPTWSPDGKWIAFLSNRNDNWGVWVLHYQTGTTQQLFNFEDVTISASTDMADWWREQLSWSG